jgi:uncharacterized membrane protein
MNKQLLYLILIYGITGSTLFILVLMREFYDEKFTHKLGLNTKSKYIECDFMCFSHFIMYILLGYLSPKYWMISFTLSILWEYSEQYMEKKNIKIISNFRNDIITNTSGLIIGLLLHKIKM